MTPICFLQKAILHYDIISHDQELMPSKADDKIYAMVHDSFSLRRHWEVLRLVGSNTDCFELPSDNDDFSVGFF